MSFQELKSEVLNRGIPPDKFLEELVSWGKTAPDEIFSVSQHRDVYANIEGVLGPWEGLEHRRAVMLEVMRVLAGFESSWHWQAGMDSNTAHPEDSRTWEAGAWQVSADSMDQGQELRNLVLKRAGSDDAKTFQQAMKDDHLLAMEYIARLLRRTVRANGPVLRHEIDNWVRKGAVEEFRRFLREVS